MIVKAYYAGGRIDVFDTDRMTDGIPQPGNLLTNYTLDLADVGNECLWLRSYYYEAADTYKNEAGPTELPVARRRDGWSFLIADEEDLEKLNRLTIDGETALVKVADELVDVAALSWAYDVIGEYIPMISTACKQAHWLSPESDCLSVSLCESIGIPRSVISAVCGNDSPAHI